MPVRSAPVEGRKQAAVSEIAGKRTDDGPVRPSGPSHLDGSSLERPAPAKLTSNKNITVGVIEGRESDDGPHTNVRGYVAHAARQREQGPPAELKPITAAAQEKGIEVSEQVGRQDQAAVYTTIAAAEDDE